MKTGVTPWLGIIFGGGTAAVALLSLNNTRIGIELVTNRIAIIKKPSLFKSSTSVTMKYSV